MSAATAWPLAAAAAASGGPGAGRRPPSRRREIWLGGSCPPPEAAASPLGAELLLFLACCRARSTGVRRPLLASFGDITLVSDKGCKTKAVQQGSRTRRAADFEQRAPPLVQEGSK